MCQAEEVAVHPRIAGDLRVEGGTEQASLLHEDRKALVACQDLYSLPDPRDHGSPDEGDPEGRGVHRGAVEVVLEALPLPALRVALHGHVQKPQKGRLTP